MKATNFLRRTVNGGRDFPGGKLRNPGKKRRTRIERSEGKRKMVVGA